MIGCTSGMPENVCSWTSPDSAWTARNCNYRDKLCVSRTVAALSQLYLKNLQQLIVFHAKRLYYLLHDPVYYHSELVDILLANNVKLIGTATACPCIEGHTESAI